MTVSEIQNILDNHFPENAAEEWDNVGLLYGGADWDVQKIYVALDATDEVVSHAVKLDCDLIVTHHPMIFSSIKRINDGDFLGKKLLMLGQNRIACYAMHTNYDAYRMGDLADEKLGLSDTEVLNVNFWLFEDDDEGINGEMVDRGIGSIGNLKKAISLKGLAENVKKAFDIQAVRVFGDVNQSIKRVAMLPGSGKSDIDLAIEKGADVMITGDIDHHTGIDTLQKGMALIDAGHYGIEHIFIDDVRRMLSKECDGVEVFAEEKREPFVTI